MPVSIAIIGAGPAGLTLARLLQVSPISNHISVTIFERDASAKSRLFQGGTLDLHSDTGLAALKKCGLWKEALERLRYDGEEMIIADKNDTRVLHMQGEVPGIKTKEIGDKFERPEMDREVLKDLLLDSVDKKDVRWGKTLQTIDPNTRVLTFRDGTTAGPFDLVVGADGGWSKVRQVLTDVKPQYAGVCGFEGHILKPNEEYPKLSKMVGRGSYFSYSDEKFLSAQRLGDESIKVAAWVKREGTKGESWPADMMAAYGDNEEKLKDKILEDFLDWTPQQRQFIKVASNWRPWPLYELPPGRFWEHKRGFSMVGDASSLMTPFAGEGVNKAMKDSLELVEQLESAIKDDSDSNNMDEAVKRYEENMFPRAKKWQLNTMRNKHGMFSKKGPSAFLVCFVDDIAEEMGKDLKRGFWSWIPFKTVVWTYVVSRQAIGSLRRKLSSMIWTEE